MDKLDCSKCPEKGICCRDGVDVDLDEAKKIAELGLLGKFFNLEVDADKEYPSGYYLPTSNEGQPCTFLCPDGKCSIHKVDYKLKPTNCKNFPFLDKNKNVLPIAKQLCIML